MEHNFKLPTLSLDAQLWGLQGLSWAAVEIR